VKTLLGLGLGFCVGVALWSAANLIDGVREPWDGANFLVFYVAALLLSGGFGLLTANRAWMIGSAVVFAMLPVMLVSGGGEMGALIGLGVILLAIMALPAAGAAELAFRLRRRAATAW
jgi:Na+/citrate or Na+/malate symporter